MKYEIKCIKKESNIFPKKLKKLEKCPDQIFVLGNEKILNEFSLSIIGSRNCSFVGKEIARKISCELSELEIPIVSGFARGIDTIAHECCIKMKNKTIAVLGGGHAKIYPKENIKLVNKILDMDGAIISEYPLEYPTLPNNFRERNRIIAALSDGVVLIEAKSNSGSLITIDYAKKLNKKVFVVPGNIEDKLYEGSNKVLVEGAFCVRNGNDILRNYKQFSERKNKAKTKNTVDLEEDLKEVYESLNYLPKSLEEICENFKKSPDEIVYKLTLLELKGLIIKVDRQRFIKI